ncbi:MAG: transglutaminase, partial [Flavobacteriaceae bacterium]|nr:transglutaminase [Flavobacteriaceae bacterium]
TKDGYNYVIAGVENASGVILLDATEKYSTPNVLPLRVLNWEGRLIRKQGTSTTISLYPKKYNAKNTKLSVKLNSEGTITGLMNTSYSNLNALQYRDEYNSLSEDDLISKLETENNGIEIEKIRINNKTKISKPITEYIQFTRENQADIIGDKIYISPLLFLTTNENPFKLKERLYPIDYGSAWKNDYKISIQIPEGFKVESKPEDISLMLPNNMGSYILKTKIENNKINVTSQTKINIAIIGSNHYKVLKELYKQAIDRQLEKIVLVQGQP